MKKSESIKPISALTSQSNAATLLSRAAIKILLIPLDDAITQQEMLEYLTLFHAVDSFPLDQLNYPKQPLQSSTASPSAVSNSSVNGASLIAQHATRNAWIQLRFVECVTQDDINNHFNSHEQPVALIGIMHCSASSEALESAQKSSPLNRIYSNSIPSILKQCPSILHHKCFAFEKSESPNATTVSNNNDIIVIPNQKTSQILLYLNTFLAGFVVDLTQKLADKLLAILDRRQLLNYNPPAPISRSSIPSSHSSMNKLNIAESVLSLDEQSASASDSKIDTMATVHEIAETSVQNSPVVLSSQLSPAVTTIATSDQDSAREKKKVPGRIQKLSADIYLMLGCWNRALQCFDVAVDMAKSANDHVYQASALEGALAAQFLLTLADLAKCDFSQPNNSAITDYSAKFYKLLSETGKTVDEICVCYNKSGHIQLKLGFLLSVAEFMTVFGLISQITLSDENSYLEKHFKSPIESAIENNLDLAESLIRKHDIKLRIDSNQFTRKDASLFIMRVWDGGLVLMPIGEQVMICGRLSRLFSMLKYGRKSAFFMRQTLLALTSLIRDEANIASNASKSIYGKEIMKLIMMIISNYSISPTDFIEQNNTSSNSSKRGKYGKQQSFGWNILKIQALTEAVKACETLREFHYAAFFILLQLQILSQDSAEKNPFFDIDDIYEAKNRIHLSLKRIANKLTYLSQRTVHQSTLPNGISIEAAKLEIDFFNCFSSLDKLRLNINASKHQQSPRPIILTAPIPNAEHVQERNPFIYNPFEARKKLNSSVVQEKPVAVKGEALELEISLNNFFDFDICVEQCAVVFNVPSVELNNVKTTMLTELPVFIPTGQKSPTVLKFSVTVRPMFSLTSFTITGCILKLDHGWFEFLPLFNNDNTAGGGNSTNIQLSVREIFQDPPKLSDSTGKGFEVALYPPMPLLKIISTNLTRNFCWMLFEGQRSTVDIVLRNIGSSDVDYLHVNMVTKMNAEAGSDYLSLYEQECLGSLSKVNNVEWMKEKDFKSRISTGEESKVILSAYGQKGCVAGEVEIIYGCSVDSAKYVRKALIPIQITVRPALVVERLDFLQFDSLKSSSVTINNVLGIETESTGKSMKPNSSVEELVLSPSKENPITFDDLDNNQCLFVADIRNTWSHPFKVCFHLSPLKREGKDEDKFEQFDPRINPISHELNNKKSMITTESVLIYPYQSKRIAIPVEKLDLEEFFRYIYETCEDDAQMQKEFVISKVEGDPIQFVPPIPVPRSKQYAQQSNKKQYSVIVDSILKALKKKLAKLSEKHKKQYSKMSVNMNALKKCWLNSQVLESIDLDNMDEYKEHCIHEQQSRISFWFRDQFFRRRVLGASWTFAGSFDGPECPMGWLELRKVPFTNSMLRHLRKSPIELAVSFKTHSSLDCHVEYHEFNQWFIKTSTKTQAKVEMEVKLKNIEPSTMIVRYQIYQDSSEYDGRVLFDLHDKVINMNDSCQTVLLPREDSGGNGEQLWKIPLIFFASGRYKIVFHGQIVKKQWEMPYLQTEMTMNELNWRWTEEPIIMDVSVS